MRPLYQIFLNILLRSIVELSIRLLQHGPPRNIPEGREVVRFHITLVIESTHLHKYDDRCVEEKYRNGRVVICNRGVAHNVKRLYLNCQGYY